MVQGRLEARLVYGYGAQGKLEVQLPYKGNLRHGYGTRETWCTVSARLRYKGNLKHGYGTRETWNTVMVQGKLEARLWYKGNLKHG